jgi:hypothetical protein
MKVTVFLSGGLSGQTVQNEFAQTIYMQKKGKK